MIIARARRVTACPSLRCARKDRVLRRVISMSENGERRCETDAYNAAMLLDSQRCYQALKAHDARFDGRFFVGVSSTRIYCRPVCTVKTPKQRELPLLPQRGGGRVGGLPPLPALPARARPWQRQHRCRARGWHKPPPSLIEDGLLNETGIDELAARSGRDRSTSAPRVSDGVRRLARRVRTDASAAAGQAPADRHRLAGHRGRDGERLRQLAALQCAVPRSAIGSVLRICARRPTADNPPTCSSSQLGYRPPLDWEALLSFLGDARDRRRGAASRMGCIARTVRIEQGGKDACGLDRRRAGQAQAQRSRSLSRLRLRRPFRPYSRA